MIRPLPLDVTLSAVTIGAPATLTLPTDAVAARTPPRSTENKKKNTYAHAGNRNDDLDIYSLGSLAIVMSYFSIGVSLELLYTPIAYYLIDDLGAESGVYTVWVILVTLPWSFKV